MYLNRFSVLMLSALLMTTANASLLSVEEKLSQRMLMSSVGSSSNNQNNNANARQLLDQVRQNKKHIPIGATAAQFQDDKNHNERRIQVVSELRSQLRSKNNNQNNVNHQRMLWDASVQRKLPMTGHIWDACLPDSTPTNEEITAATFNMTAYDDNLNPECACLYDPEVQQLWLQCAMGDTNCINGSNNTCEETHEIFIFSQSTGDLSIKNTCNFCTDFTMTNCTGIQEICSVVYFDDNETPEQCFFQELLLDGSLVRCDNCQICSDSDGAKGMNYDCFDQTTNGGCDTTQSFHVHNFAPVTTSGPNDVGGRFGDICRKNEEFALYEKTTYDNPFSKVCDCDDPTSGIIVCDLFFAAEFCIANECSPISEIFYFDKNDGELSNKVTCDASNGLCTDIAFDDNDGTPTSCEAILFPDPTPCTTCNICQDETTNAYGIQFKCFGIDQRKCLTSNGRAVNNFVDQPTAPPTSAVEDPPQDDGTRTVPPTSNGDDESQVAAALSEEPSVPAGAIVGAFVGGLALSGLFALFYARKNKTDIEQETNPTGMDHDPPVDEAHEDEIMDEAEPPEVPTLT